LVNAPLSASRVKAMCRDGLKPLRRLDHLPSPKLRKLSIEDVKIERRSRSFERRSPARLSIQ